MEAEKQNSLFSTSSGKKTKKSHHRTCLVSPAVLAGVIKDIISSHGFFCEQATATVVLLHESH